MDRRVGTPSTAQKQFLDTTNTLVVPDIMSGPIILYDIPGRNPECKAWSPNTWATSVRNAQLELFGGPFTIHSFH